MQAKSTEEFLLSSPCLDFLPAERALNSWPAAADVGNL